MVSTVATTALTYQVRGAIGYLRDEQKFPTMGMGLVARFGGHNAAVYLALQKKADCSISGSSQSACNPPRRADALKLLAGAPPYRRDSHRVDSGAFARMACQLYDCLGQFSRPLSTGRQLDLTA